MPFLTYAGTRPWAKAIREAVLTRAMPPWFADPKYGHFSNDRSLAASEIDTLVNWADSGALEGNAQDAPRARDWPPGWTIGKPDVVFEMPAKFSVPAAGAVEYQYIILPAQFAEDKWIERVEVAPGNRALIHHAVVYVREPGSRWLADQPRGAIFALASTSTHQPNPASFTTSDILMVYTPGNAFEQWPPGVAKKIKAGSDIVLQIHYTANGRAATDRTRVGLIFSKAPPKQAVLTLQMGNDRFVIPPGDPDYHVSVSGTLPNDALLVALLPHMHLRGKSFDYQIVSSNGAVETLLKVDRYDFHWQINYQLAAPRLLRAGTRLRWEASFDNSPNNRRNPDPGAEVRFGEQSWEEMMIGFFDVLVDSGVDKSAFFQRKH